MNVDSHPVLSLPLEQVLRPEIAITLREMLQIYTVGQFLFAWQSPGGRHHIEPLFDSPLQAQHAARVCATWMGVRFISPTNLIDAWWQDDARRAA